MKEKKGKYIKFLGLEMEKNYWISASIGIALMVIGFLMVVIGSSPAWFQSLGSAVGVVGAIGTWLTALTSATKRTLREEHDLTRKPLGRHTKLLSEIRDSIRKR